MMGRLFTPLWLIGLVLAVPAPIPGWDYPPSCSVTIGGSAISKTKTPAGACRYSIKYATAERWAPPSPVLEIHGDGVGSMPPQCPQQNGTYVDGGSSSEDCLYAVVYTPRDLGPGSAVPVFTWLHGGSFMAGGASAPGLDGSTLAIQGKIIVVVVQYRLGVLGFLPPFSSPSASDPNLGMMDVITALSAIKSYVSQLGGDPAKVTIGGQSSGAGMIRALLGAPAARGLFRAAILQSDPMIYGFASPNVTAQLQSAYYAQESLSACTDLACLQALPVSTLLDAQSGLLMTAPTTIPGVPAAEVFRPTHHTNSLPYDPTSLLWSNPDSLYFPPQNLPLLITTTANEAGTVISSLFPGPTPQSDQMLQYVLYQLMDPTRAAAIVASPNYAAADWNGSDGFREKLERIITDGVWRCPNRDVAKRWAAAGGTVYVGEWREGASYPDNQGVGYCQGKVCHEDDIYPTFSTAPPSTEIFPLFEDEIRIRWTSFIKTLNPNSPQTLRDRWIDFLCWWRPRRQHRPRETRATWSPYGGNGNQESVFPLGGDGQVTDCPPDLWGTAVQYDWQLYQ